VCLRADSPLAAQAAVTPEDLFSAALIVMRSGYLMHRFVHRLLEGRLPSVSYSTDGGEMGKLMVAEGLGVTVLPDFSVIGDPMERGGLITWRPLAGDHTEIQLCLRRRRTASHSVATRHLHGLFVTHARRYENDQQIMPPAASHVA
jgi:DNA-binding transcriptional LysR family regulator